MTAPIVEGLSSQLVSTSVSSAMLAIGVWLACRFMPGLSPAVRATLWWLVAAKLVVGLVWITPVSLPVLPPDVPAVPAMVASTPGAAEGLRVADSAAVVAAASMAPARRAYPWLSAVVLGWLCAVVVLAARFVWQLRRSRRLLSAAVPADAVLIAAARDAARRLGVSRIPDVCVSDEIAMPMLVGLRRPRVIVPRERFNALSAAEQRMALCHELAHYRRRDLWLGLIPALAERLFFFHPAARLAAREYLVAREAACDAEVIAALDVSPRDYGRLLLTLGVAPMSTRLAAAGASHTVSTLKRRIVMLGLPSPTRKVRTASWAIAAAAVCAVAPVRLVGRAVVVPVPEAGTAVTRSADPAVPPVVATSVATVQAPEKMVVKRDRDRLEYALMTDGSSMMSGSIDSRRLDALRGSSPRLLWFKVDGREYVVRNDAAIDRAAEVLRPIREIGKAQGEVGSRQGVIGAQQGEVGAQQGRVGARQGDLGARQGALGAKQAEIAAKQAALAAREAGASEALRRRLDEERAALDAQMRELDEQMRELDDQMRDLDEEMRKADEPMADLDAKMRVLDDEMRALDTKMREAEPKVLAELRALIDRLVADKVAEPVQ